MHTTFTGTQVKLEQLLSLAPFGKQLDLHAQHTLKRRKPGTIKQRQRGLGIEFSEVRHYQNGDEIRHIDWRVTARRGTVHSKVFHEETERHVFIVVDYSDSLFFGTQVCFKSVIAAQVASLLAFSAHHHGDKLQALIARGSELDEIPLQRHALMHLLNRLCTTSPAKHYQPLDYTKILSHLHKSTRTNSIIVFISDFYHFDEQHAQALQAMAHSQTVIGLQISDPLERRLPLSARYALQDHKHHVCTIDASSPAVLTAYQTDYEQQLEPLRRAFSRLSAPLIELSTDDNILLRLQRIFSRKSYHGL